MAGVFPARLDVERLSRVDSLKNSGALSIRITLGELSASGDMRRGLRMT